MILSANDECVELIREAALPLPGHRRTQFYERVSQLLKNADVLVPARVLEACRQAQGEFLIGGPIDSRRRTAAGAGAAIALSPPAGLMSPIQEPRWALEQAGAAEGERTRPVAQS